MLEASVWRAGAVQALNSNSDTKDTSRKLMEQHLKARMIFWGRFNMVIAVWFEIFTVSTVKLLI